MNILGQQQGPKVSGVSAEDLRELDDEPEIPLKDVFDSDEDYVNALVLYELELARRQNIEFQDGIGPDEEQLNDAINKGYKLSKVAVDSGFFEVEEPDRAKSRSKSPGRRSPKPKPEKGPRKNARQASPEKINVRRGVFAAPLYANRKTQKPKQCQETFCEHDNQYVGIKKGKCECLYYRQVYEICPNVLCPKNKAIITSDDQAALLGKQKCDCYIPADIKKQLNEARARERAAKKEKTLLQKRQREVDLALMSSAERKKLIDEEREEAEYEKQEKKRLRQEKQKEKEEKNYLARLV
jgi:hypothetical protein